MTEAPIVKRNDNEAAEYADFSWQSEHKKVEYG